MAQTPEQAPQPAVEAQERTWAALTHAATFTAYVTGGVGLIVGPLVMWLIKKDQMPFVDVHGKQAVNFNLSMLIYLIVAAISIFAFIGFVLFPALLIFHLVVSIIAAVKASNGEYYSYPLAIRFIQ